MSRDPIAGPSGAPVPSRAMQERPVEDGATEAPPKAGSSRVLAVALRSWEVALGRRWVHAAWCRWRRVRAAGGDWHDGGASDPSVRDGGIGDGHMDRACLPAVALAEPVGNDWRIVACCARAGSQGVRAGMSRAEAESCDRTGARFTEADVNGICSPPAARRTDAGTCVAAGVESRATASSAAWLEDLRRGAGGMASFRDRFVSFDARLLVLRRMESVARRQAVRLGLALERWVPGVSIDGPWLSDPGMACGHPGARGDWHPCDADPALVGDLGGCGRLFRVMHGSEQVLMQRVRESLLRRGVDAWIATASTPGAAVAIARHGCSDVRPTRAVPTGGEREALDPLPVSALRIGPSSLVALAAVEVHTIGQLAQLARRGVAARLSGWVASTTEHEAGERAGAGGVDFRNATDAAGTEGGHAEAMHAGRTPAGEIRPGAARSRRSRTGRRTGSGGGSRASRDRGARGAGRTDGWDGASDGGLFASVDEDSAPRVVDTGSSERSDAGAFSTCNASSNQEVLVRLDQALGRRSEVRPKIQAAEEIVVHRAFDGPCSRLETLVTACSQLLDEMVCRLARRRLGVRGATWRFRHADLPTDLSSDAVLRCIPIEDPGASGPRRSGASLAGSDGRQPGASRGATPRHDVASEHGVDLRRSSNHPVHRRAATRAARGWTTTIELRPSRPSSCREHLWDVLAPRLERIALDHGVEAVECRVDEVSLLRVSQLRMRLPSCDEDPRSAAASEGVGCREALERWIDVVRARGEARRQEGGGRTVVRVVAGEGMSRLESSESMPRSSREDGVDPSDNGRRHAGVQPVSSWCESPGLRPFQILATPEESVLRIGSGAPGHAQDLMEDAAEDMAEDMAEELAEVVACRRAWHRSREFTPCPRRLIRPHDAEASSCRVVQRMPSRCTTDDGAARIDVVAAPTPALWWRGRWRAVLAVDGWERTEPAWWNSEPPEHGIGASGRCSDMRCRISVEPGLWLLVRWPARLPTRSIFPGRHSLPDGACVSAVDARASSQSVHMPTIHLERAARMVEAGTGAVVMRRWIESCKQALRSGIPLEIRGLWG